MKREYFDNKVTIYNSKVSVYKKDPDLALARYESEIKDKISKQLSQHGNVKINLGLHTSFIKFNFVQDDFVSTDVWFNSDARSVLSKKDIMPVLKDTFSQILSAYDVFMEQGSGFILDKLLHVRLSIFKVNALAGGCRTSMLRLPKSIRDKHACISLDCTGNKCFLYSVLAGLFPSAGKNLHRTSLYAKHASKLNCKDLRYPVGLDQIPRFEKTNNVSINVFTLDHNHRPYVVHLTINRGARAHVNLLLYKSHYWYIKQLSRLLHKVYKKKNVTLFFCDYCLNQSYTKLKHDQHTKECNSIGQVVSVPPPKSYLKFKDYHRKVPAPFVIYVDFESLCVGHNEVHGRTKRLDKHVPFAFGAVRYCSSNEEFTSEPHLVFSKEGCIKAFIDYLFQQKHLIEHIIRDCSYPLQMSDSDLDDFARQTRCYMCGLKFTKYLGAYRDHDHLKRGYNYRGKACNRCNLCYSALKIPTKVPVLIHNLMNYDSHVIISEIMKFVKSKINVLPKNSEKILTFGFDIFEFVDTYAFLSASLKNLSDDLGKANCHYTQKHTGAECLDYAFRKGVYPYDYLTSYEKLFECSLPPIHSFFNKLTNENLAEEEYNFALEVWDVFKCTNLLDYTKVYLKIDVQLLCDVFEAFRERWMRIFQLDPAKHISFSQLSFQAMLLKTGANFELLNDVEMYTFFEKGLRGGVASVMTRFAKANNPLVRDYDPSEPISYILNLDCNALYSYCMMQKLPYRNFRWLTEREVSAFNLAEIDVDGDTGYVLCVDMEYPKHLHDLHNYFPLAPEKYKTNPKDLSPYSIQSAAKLGMKLCGNVQKLIPNFYTKKDYNVHFANLKYYVEKGLIVNKIHKVLAFKQKSVLLPYIRMNNTLRQKACNEFEKYIFKLANNTVFGKGCESVRNRMDVKLVSDPSQCEKFVSRPNFKSFKMCNENLALVQLKKRRVLLNKPIYMGFTVLDLAKLHMYRFLYDVLIPMCGGQDHFTLLYTDTDSLFCSVNCPDVYELMLDNLLFFDTSNYEKNHKCFSEINTRVPGVFKDEMGGKAIEEFCGLRAKSYSFRLPENEIKHCKGIKTCVIKCMRHADFMMSLCNNTTLNVTYNAIRSYGHTIYTCQHEKLGLNPLDDKRYILSDGITTYGLGHWRIHSTNKRELENEEEL